MPPLLCQPMQNARQSITEGAMLVGGIEDGSDEDQDGEGEEGERQWAAEAVRWQMEDRRRKMGRRGRRMEGSFRGMFPVQPDDDDCQRRKDDIADSI